MGSEPLAAAIAFLALGANGLGTTFQLLVAPRSRTVRWFALFEANIMLWLGLQGWIFATGEIGSLGPLYEGTVHMLPGIFLATTLVDVRGWSDAKALGVVALSAALLPISLGNLIGGAGDTGLVMVWQVLGWTAGSVLHARSRPAVDPGVRRRLRAAVGWTLLAIGPVAVVAGWLAGGDFFVYVMPLLTIGMHVLVLFGIVHLRFYDIEVRASRSGQTAARAAEIERLAVVGEMAASFAHEVRNPLTGVRSLAQRLAEEDVTEPKRRQYAELMVREISRVDGIVARILGVARRAPGADGDRGPTPLEPLFEDLRLLVAGRAERQGVEIRVKPGGLAAAAGRDALAQVLLNLLLNALDHSPEGGAVELAAGRAGESVLLTVRDQGPGVPATERDRVFDALYSGTGGTGLGLAVVRRVTGEHGWSIEVADAPGGGAEFRLGIPA